MLSNIKTCNDLPPTLRDMILNDMYQLGQEYDEHQRRIRQEHEQVINDRSGLYSQLNETHNKLRDANLERDNYWNERDVLKRQLNELQFKSQKINEDFEILRRERDSLVKKVAFQEEQLRGKRALWMEAHPESSARRTAMSARDPFTSPSVSHSGSFDNSFGGLGALVSPIPGPSTGSFAALSPGRPPFDAPRGPKRRGQLPTGRALPAREIPATSWHPSSTRINTEAGSPPPSMALVVRSENIGPEYQKEIGRIYALVEGWVNSYAHIPNLASDRAIAQSNDILWDYMMNCTYPGQRQDSHSHVITLLNDKNSRSWFVMRMAVTYVCRDIFVIDAFSMFDREAAATVAEVKHKLQERGKQILQMRYWLIEN